jgi:hypothetical protein
VVHVGPGFGELPCWRITTTCRRHRRPYERFAVADSCPGFPGASTFGPDVDAVLDWIHADPDRCGIGYLSITCPEQDRVPD